MTDCTLIEKLLKVHFLLGVSYKKISHSIGLTSTSLYRFRKVRPNSISDLKKMQLNDLLDSYLQITHREEEKENR